ncbi:MAG: 1-deoxy-D-xylulose-5-phosphate reductoisomerase, partial [Bacilli bacterium]|nr:1-deoxy-D-xylulose-5-phosphate reductoisomerase [Bacilli bacterium]
MKKICILGITGSIGSQAVDVINNLDGYIVESASCNTSYEKLDKYISDLNLKSVWVKEKSFL